MEVLTNRDKEYLRVLFLLRGSVNPVGPVELSKKIGVSKVCAFQKMRRLEVLGYGKYILRKGLQLNNRAISVVEQDIKRHHIIEEFLQSKLGLSHEMACIEAEELDKSMSKHLFNKIKKNSTLSSSCCTYDPVKKPTANDLKKCPWMKRLICKS